jgi:N-acyl-D-amino-acid deacylase
MSPRLSLGCVALALLAGLAARVPSQPPPGQPPGTVEKLYRVTGKGHPILDPLDDAIQQIMSRHGIPGGAVAVTFKGKLVYAKGFGWSNLDADEAVKPDTLFGLASVSKVFTALAVFKLVEAGKLKLDDSAFEILKHLQPPRGANVDPRVARITVRHLLNHSGGWNRNVTGDPINWSRQVAARLQVRMPITEDQLIRFVLGVPLDFDPGTESQYSNFGYIVLGQIVARVSGQTYEAYVRKNVLEPAGTTKPRLYGAEGRYFPGESLHYLPGSDRVLPAYNMPWTDASGGWTASAVDLARVLAALDGNRGKPLLSEATQKEMFAKPPEPLKPNPDGTWVGLGWDTIGVSPKGEVGYSKGGSWPGIRSSVKHRFDGLNTVALFNASAEPDSVDARIGSGAAKEIHDRVSKLKITEAPAEDLFKEFP